MRSNWRRHRGQAYIPCPAGGLEQGHTRNPRSNTESMELSILLHTSQFLVAWHLMALPAFVLQPSLALSCLPHASRTFCVHKCVL